MLNQNITKYGSVQKAMDTWRDYMVSMGFGYKLGIDLPGEKRGLIPNSQFYDKAYKGSWNGLTIISISIGQGEVLLTPLQIANLGATIANRGYYYVPHVVRKVQGEPIDTAFTRRHYTKAERTAYDYVVQGMRSSALIAVAVYVENGGWGATYGVPIGGLIMEQYIKGKLSEASLAKAQSIQERRIAYGTTDR